MLIVKWKLGWQKTERKEGKVSKPASAAKQYKLENLPSLTNSFFVIRFYLFKLYISLYVQSSCLYINTDIEHLYNKYFLYFTSEQSPLCNPALSHVAITCPYLCAENIKNAQICLLF